MTREQLQAESDRHLYIAESIRESMHNARPSKWGSLKNKAIHHEALSEKFAALAEQAQ